MNTRKIGFWGAVMGVSYLTPFLVKAVARKTGWSPLVQFDNYIHDQTGAC